jgi:hypothetical protein
VAGLSAWAAVEALSWPAPAAFFPLAIGIPLFLLASLEAVLALAAPAEELARRGGVSDGLAAGGHARPELATLAWILGGFLSVIGLGFQTSVFLFVACYLRFEGSESWIRSSLLAAGAWMIFHVIFERVLHVPFPAGWLVPLQ